MIILNSIMLVMVIDYILYNKEFHLTISPRDIYQCKEVFGCHENSIGCNGNSIGYQVNNIECRGNSIGCH